MLKVIFAGINMLGILTTKTANSWLDYKRSKAMTHIMKALYKNDKFFSQQTESSKQQFWLKHHSLTKKLWKNRNNRHNEDLDILDQNIHKFLRVTMKSSTRWPWHQAKHYLVIKILTKYCQLTQNPQEVQRILWHLHKGVWRLSLSTGCLIKSKTSTPDNRPWNNGKISLGNNILPSKFITKLQVYSQTYIQLI